MKCFPYYFCKSKMSEPRISCFLLLIGLLTFTNVMAADVTLRLMYARWVLFSVHELDKSIYYFLLSFQRYAHLEYGEEPFSKSRMMVTPQNNKCIPQAVYKNRYLLFYLSVSTYAMIGLFHCPARSIQNFVLIAKMSQDENFETLLKEKYANQQKKTNLRSRYPRLSSWFFRDYGGRQATNGGKWARRRQLDSRTRWFHRRRKVVKHTQKDIKTKC